MTTHTDDRAELLPCPHCGEREHLYPAYRLDKNGKCIEPPYAIDCLGCGHDFTPREGVDARVAWNRRPALPSVEGLVAVKPLKWDWSEPHSTWHVESVVGAYRAWEIAGSACVIRPGDKAGVIVGISIGAAKAAAQADYSRRILSAIDTTALSARLAEAERELAQATDPEYLTGALEKVGVVDAEWKARAEAAEARVKALTERLAEMEAAR